MDWGVIARRQLGPWKSICGHAPADLEQGAHVPGVELLAVQFIERRRDEREIEVDPVALRCRVNPIQVADSLRSGERSYCPRCNAQRPPFHAQPVCINASVADDI